MLSYIWPIALIVLSNTVYQICAKSGTAEVGDGTSHAWFVGFLDDPSNPYAFVVVVEHGGGGLAAAGSVANTVLQALVN